MLSPPRHASWMTLAELRELQTPLPRTGEARGLSYGENKVRRKGDRNTIVQCDRCGVHGTGIVRAKRLVTTNLPEVKHPNGTVHHVDCGGLFVLYDITEADE